MYPERRRADSTAAFVSLQSPETSLAHVSRWVAVGDRRRILRRAHATQCRRFRTVHFLRLIGSDNAYNRRSDDDRAYEMDG